MQAVILCGGRGERLMPLTECRPAALLRITGKPIIEYAFEQLKKAGFKEITLALGYLGSMIFAEFDSGKYDKMKIHFSANSQNGTASAIKNAFSGDDILIAEANCLFDFDIKKLLSFHRINNADCTIVTKSCKDYTEHTCVSADDKGLVKSVTKNPSHDNLNAFHAVTGVYIISRNVFSDYSFTDGLDFVKDLLPQLISDYKKVLSFSDQGYWQKVTDSQGFLACQHDMLSGKTGINIGSKYKENNIYSESESNFNGISVVGPVYIGKNVSIEKGSTINPYSVIDDNSIISKRTTIDGAYIGQNAVIEQCCEISSSVVCNNALIKQSSQCGENSVIGEKATVGESSRIADNAKIRAEKYISPNTTVTKDIKTGICRSISIDDNCECTVGNGSTSPADFARLGMAIGSSLNKNDIVVVGYSDDYTAKILSDSLISGILSTGLKVFRMGKCSCQQIMFILTRLSGKIGCFVTADYTERVKLMNKGCLPLKHDVEKAIENAYNNNSFRSLCIGEYGKSYDISDAKILYEIFLEKLLPAKFNYINAEIRCTSKETAQTADSIINPKNDINGEHVVFHISADGSSCSVYSDKTGYVFHERLIMLALSICFEKQIPVSLPFSFPIKADEIAEKYGGKIYRYYNCSDDDSDVKARKVAVRTDNMFVRDGLMLICIICAYLSEKKIGFSEAIKEIPAVATVQRFVSIKEDPLVLLDTFAVSQAGLNEGIVYMKENARALIRPQKNAKGLMIFAESFKSEQASSICDDIQDMLKKHEDKYNKISHSCVIFFT